MERVWFTGTRHGMTEAQFKTLAEVLTELRKHHDTFHHGDCIGADAQAFALAHAFGYRTEAHPSDLPGTQARTPSTITHPPKPPLLRNNDMAMIGDIGVATPNGPERLRSGTWAAVRCSRVFKKLVIVIWPDGSKTLT